MPSVEFVSLPGPRDRGGVGPTINWIVENILQDATWVHFTGGQWQRTGCTMPLGICDPSLTGGHHRYVHEFLWPLLIGLPELATYSSSDHAAYELFNEQLTQHLLRSSTITCINDHELSIEGSLRIWHGPMPGEVPAHFVQHFSPFIESLLRTKSMVFHTQAFIDNLLQYVDANLHAQYHIDRDTNTLTRQADQAQVRLFAFPLGIDSAYWANAVEKGVPLPINTADKKIIFLAGRCDPAKAWELSLEAIERFLHRFPQRDEILVVVQCGRIHSGLTLYDSLWERVQLRRKRLEDLFGDSVVFIDNHLPHKQLAWLYRNTSVMLVAPRKDGQPLVAKEYVACQRRDDPDGVLLLSAGAGVWHEFRDGVVEVNPGEPTDVANTIIDALQRDRSERRRMMQTLRRVVLSNTLHQWWDNIAAAAGINNDSVA